MRNPLRKRYPRDLKSNFGRYLAIFLMMVATIAIMSGFLSVSDGVQIALYKSWEESKVEDGLFSSFKEINTDTLHEIEELGVSVYENHYVNEEILDKRVLRIYANRENTNLVTAMKGSLPKKKNEIAIERLFAENNDIEIGSTIPLLDTDMMVTAYVSMPDYSSLFEKNSNLMMDSFSFGVGIVTKEAFSEYADNALIFNYSYYINDRTLSNREKIDLSNDILETLVRNNTMLTNFCTAENNNSITFIEDDIASDLPMMLMLLNIIIVIMAFVFSIVISSTIDAEAQYIGTLLASGYGKHELISHYMGLPIIVTLVSALIGNILGYTVMPILFKGIFYNSFSLPPMEVQVNIRALLLTTVLPIFIMIIINFITLYRKLSISPLNFLRKDLRKNKKQRAIKLPNLSFIRRFRIRIIIQNRYNYIILLVGMYLATVILMFGLGMSPVVNNYLDSIKDSTISDYQYILKAPMEVRNGDMGEKFTLTSLETYYKAGKKNIEVMVYGLEDNSRYIPEITASDNKDKIYFSDSLVKKLKKNIGDVVTFRDSYTWDEYELEIMGIYDYTAGLAVFMSRNRLNNLLNHEYDYFNGYFSDDKLSFDDENYIATVITLEDMISLGAQMTSSFSQMAPLCLGLAVIIYLSLIYILTKIVIDKNAIHISFMKVFGYEENEIKKLYLTPTTLVVITALLFGIPMAYLTIKLCFEVVMMKISGYIPIYIPTYLFGEIAIIGLVSYFIINFFHKKLVYGIEMAAALKNKE